MAPERIGHVRAEAAAWAALCQAIRAGGADWEALGDGVTVPIGQDADYEPDALVYCGDRVDGESLAVADPVIVVEVA